MAYAAQADIESEFKNTAFTASTAITATDVAAFIAQAEARINAVLSPVYVTPLTSADGILIAKQISVNMVKCRIVRIITVKTGDAKIDQADSGKTYCDEAKEMLDDLTSKKILLSGETLAKSGGAYDSYTNTNDTEFLFDRDVDQW